MNNEDNLWAKILRDKYLKHHTFQSWPCNRSASHTWRSIMRSRDTIKEGTNGISEMENQWICGMIGGVAMALLLINIQVCTNVVTPKWRKSLRMVCGVWTIDHIVDYTSRTDILNVVIPVSHGSPLMDVFP